MSPNTGTWLAQQLMQDFGLTPAAAAGFAGNLSHESGNFRQLQEISPLVKGSRGGFGWAQWTGPRRRQFEAWSKQNGLDPTSRDANYGFLKHELANTPEGGVLKSLQGINDPSQAAQIVSNKFLRPGIPHMNSRIERSNQIASSLGSQIAAQPASPPQAPGTPAPALPEPINIAQQPATPIRSDTQPPAGLFAAMSQNAAPTADKMSGLLAMLGNMDQPQQQPMQLQPMQRQANVPSLTDYISQFISGRMA
ncbi:phage tail tip lysozyme [Brucella pituitosa]